MEMIFLYCSNYELAGNEYYQLSPIKNIRNYNLLTSNQFSINNQLSDKQFITKFEMDILRLNSSKKDFNSFNLWHSLAAEFVGTLILVFIGFGSDFDNLNPVKIGMGFGLAGVVVIYSIGNISGGHINPAVSFGLLIARQISLLRFFAYFIVQVLGAIFGFKLIYILTNGNLLKKSVLSVRINVNTTSVVESEIIQKTSSVESQFLQMLCELMITFVLVLTVMRMCVEKTRTEIEKGLAALIIGLSIAIGVYCGMNISGGSMNPAASMGKYFCTGNGPVWTQIIGPLFGGMLAGLLQQVLFTSKLSKEHIKQYFLSKDFEDKSPESQEPQPAVVLNDVDKKPKDPETGSPSTVEQTKQDQ